MTERSGTHATFVVERTYDASPARVFAAWADPAAKARWFAGPVEWVPGEHELDFRVGGREISRGGPQGGPVHAFDGRYHDIVPNQRIVFTYDMHLDDTRISVSLATVELKPAGTGTRLIFTEQGAYLDGHDTPAQREQGTGALLDALGVELGCEPARPDGLEQSTSVKPISHEAATAPTRELDQQTEENTMLIRTHVGVSLDGFVATPDGLPAWDAIPTFGPGSHGYDEVTAQCDAVVMGRTSFDQRFQDWLANWPWPDKPVYVLTSRPLPANASSVGVIASQGGPAGLLEQLGAAGLERDVQLLGGPRTIQAFLELGAIDRLGMVILPVLLGTGIPLFSLESATFSGDAWAAQASRPRAAPRSLLALERHRAFPDGAVELVYRQGT